MKRTDGIMDGYGIMNHGLLNHHGRIWHLNHELHDMTRKPGAPRGAGRAERSMDSPINGRTPLVAGRGCPVAAVGPSGPELVLKALAIGRL